MTDFPENHCADGVCFRDASGRLHPTTTVWRTDSAAHARCQGLAEECVPRCQRKAGQVVRIKIVALE